MTVLAGLAFASGLAIWWLIRKRRQRVWLPTLRIMELDAKRLPRLRMTPPPWLSFLCFLIAAATFFFFTFRPTQQVYTPFEPNQNRVHIFLDLSPSVSSETSL